MKKPPENLILGLADDLMQRYPNQKTALERLFEKIGRLPREDQAIVLKTLARYTNEAENDGYRSNPKALADFIANEKLIEGSNGFVYLGAGSGDLLFELAPRFPSIRMYGMDLSPGFVDKFNREKRFPTYSPDFLRIMRNPTQPINPSMELGLIDEPFPNEIMEDNRLSAISVLTLDRLTNPRGLIENIAKFTKAKILATLLPVVPEDDNPSRQGEGVKMIYTRPPNRIVPGCTAGGDRDVLLRLLREIWQKPVDVVNVPYSVTSSGDTQEYDLPVFYSRG